MNVFPFSVHRSNRGMVEEDITIKEILGTCKKQVNDLKRKKCENVKMKLC